MATVNGRFRATHPHYGNESHTSNFLFVTVESAHTVRLRERSNVLNVSLCAWWTNSNMRKVNPIRKSITLTHVGDGLNPGFLTGIIDVDLVLVQKNPFSDWHLVDFQWIVMGSGCRGTNFFTSDNPSNLSFCTSSVFVRLLTHISHTNIHLPMTQISSLKLLFWGILVIMVLRWIETIGGSFKMLLKNPQYVLEIRDL